MSVPGTVLTSWDKRNELAYAGLHPIFAARIRALIEHMTPLRRGWSLHPHRRKQFRQVLPAQAGVVP